MNITIYEHRKAVTQSKHEGEKQKQFPSSDNSFQSGNNLHRWCLSSRKWHLRHDYTGFKKQIKTNGLWFKMSRMWTKTLHISSYHSIDHILIQLKYTNLGLRTYLITPFTHDGQVILKFKTRLDHSKHCI